MTASGDIRAALADAGVQGWVHACRVTDPTIEVGVDPDAPVALASVYKLVVLVAYARAVDEGAIDPREQVQLLPAERTAGPAGVGRCQDPVTMSWRDLCASMITVSDNAAADALTGRLGWPRVAATVDALGLRHTTVIGGTAAGLGVLMAETGTATVGQAMGALDDLDRDLRPSGYDPLRSSASTARDLTRLLVAVWRDEAASPEQCREARAVLAARLGPLRLRAGFALPGVEVADKTGTLGALRHDVGVVGFPGEAPYAIAVLTRSARGGAEQPAVDEAIGVVGRRAVDALRRER